MSFFDAVRASVRGGGKAAEPQAPEPAVTV